MLAHFGLLQATRLVKAGLNQNRAGNFEFNGKSLRAYEEFKAKKKELIKEKAQDDQEIPAVPDVWEWRQQ